MHRRHYIEDLPKDESQRDVAVRQFNDRWGIFYATYRDHIYFWSALASWAVHSAC